MRAPRTERELHDAIRRAGFTIEQGKKHLIVRRSNGTMAMSLPLTASDHRAVKNGWAIFRKVRQQPAR